MIIQDNFSINVPNFMLQAFKSLQAHCDTIKEECLSIPTNELTKHSPPTLRDTKEYGGLKIFGFYYKFEENWMFEGYKNNLIKTLELAKSVPDVCNAYFSISEPGSETFNHTDITPFTYKVSLSIQIPEGCGFLIDDKEYDLPEGELIVWDSCTPHKVWNHNPDQSRIVFIMDVLRPNHKREEILYPDTGATGKNKFEVHD